MRTLGRRAGRPVVLLALALTMACETRASYQGRSAAEWIAQLESDRDSLQRRAAADALGRILEIDPGSAGVTNALVRALADTSDEVRLAAGTALVHDSRLPKVAIPGLLRALGDSAHVHTREHAAELLDAVRPADAGLVTPALVRSLSDPEPRVRDAVVRTLLRLGNAAPGTVDELKRVADTGSVIAREGARRVLSQLRTQGRGAVPLQSP